MSELLVEFKVDPSSLYQTWVMYLNYVAREGKAGGVIDFLRTVRLPDVAHAQAHLRALDYFLLLGLNTFSTSVLKEMVGEPVA